MKAPRSDGQRVINVPMDESFVNEIESALARAGYTDRSSFIRDAIAEALHNRNPAPGIDFYQRLAAAPSRVGKGGRPTAATAAALNETSAAKPPKGATPGEKVSYLRRKKAKP